MKKKLTQEVLGGSAYWYEEKPILDYTGMFWAKRRTKSMRFSGWRKDHLRWMQDAKPWNISKSGLEEHQKTR